MLIKETLKLELKSIIEDATYNSVRAMLFLMKEISISTDDDGNVTNAVSASDKQIAKAFQKIFVAKSVDRLANAIDSYIKSATVTVQPGQTVATAGSPAAQTGTTTSPGVGTLK